MRDALHAISLVLLFAASVWVSHESRRGSPEHLVVEILAGTAFGGVPAALLIDSSRRFRPDFGFVFLVAGFIAGTVFGGLASNAAAWLLERSRGFVARLPGSLAGGLGGSFLAYYAVKASEGGLDEYASPFQIAMAALLIGSFATLGSRLGADDRGRARPR